jgi:hypothetical protein
MKLVRNIAMASALTLAAFSAVTFTSCSKDDSGCAVGYTGSNCKDEVRASYYNTYKGNGSDNQGGTYTNFSLKFSQLGTDVTKMTMIVQDANTLPIVATTVTLTSNTTFNVDPVTTSGYSYSGTGTINESTASLTLTEQDGTSNPPVTTVYTFNNMNKQ